MKAYSKRQFAMSDFDRTGYEFNETEGVFTGTIVCKTWGKKCNIIANVDLDDGRKIICTAFQKPDNYLGLDKYEVGERLEVTYAKNKKGNNKLIVVKRAGLTEVPALVVEMDRDNAAIALVDSNLHRDNISPSEKAFAYKLKMEAMSRQGHRTDLTLSQVATKYDTDAEIGEQIKISRDQVFRYIRLTNLHPKLLEYVDEGRIAFTPAVEISYLNDIEQMDLIQTIESEDCTPSLSQAVRMKKLSQAGLLDDDKIFEIMSEEKANQKERIKIPTERVRKYFPKDFTNTQVEDTIIRLCENYYKKQQKRNTPER